MIPSSKEAAENIKKHIDAMAEEIVRRCEAGDKGSVYLYRDLIRGAARDVLTEWFLGEWLPGEEKK